MPNITFGLAGQEFTLTPYDYAPELVMDGQSMFSFEIWSTEGIFPQDAPDAIILGPHFLNAYYGVFDLSHREIRLAKDIK